MEKEIKIELEEVREIKEDKLLIEEFHDRKTLTFKYDIKDIYTSGHTLMIFEDLERDVIRFLENIALEYYPDPEDRKKIYSPKLSNILINIGSRIDEFFKNWNIVIEGAKHFYKSKEPNISDEKLRKKLKRIDIEHYKDIERNKIIILSNIDIFIPRIEKLAKPFDNWIDWGNDESPCKSWWCAYNNVKHHGYERRTEGNLDNIINSLGALFILNCEHVESRKWIQRQCLTNGELTYPSCDIRPCSKLFVYTHKIQGQRPENLSRFF